MAANPIPYLSLFAGCGGIDLALRIAEPASRCIGYVEIEAPAARNLAARMEDGSLEPAPIWSDVRTFPWELYRGRVAGILAGFPCPDYSVAGKRAGIVGKHGQLWSATAAVIDRVRPDWVFLENVPGILVPHRASRWRWDRDRRQWSQYVIPAGAWFVLGDLAALGFDAEWDCYRAAEAGLPHKRERWFCLAYRPGRGCGILREPSERNGFIGGGLQGSDTGRKADGGAGIAEPSLEHSQQPRLEKRAGGGEVVEHIQEHPPNLSKQVIYSRPDPMSGSGGDESLSSIPTLPRRLNPAFVSWLMGWPWWWTRPEPISCARAEMESYLSRQRSILSSLLGERGD